MLILRKVDNASQGSWLVSPHEPATLSITLDVAVLHAQISWLKQLPTEARGMDYASTLHLLRMLLNRATSPAQE